MTERNQKHPLAERTELCRTPDLRGVHQRRCEAIVLRTDRGETEPRQCGKQARRGRRYCDQHRARVLRPHGDVNSWDEEATDA